MNKTRNYECTFDKVGNILKHLSVYLDGKGFVCQILQNDKTPFIVFQAKKTSWLRKVSGNSTSLTIIFHNEGNITRVEIGGGEWIDEATTLGISLVIPILWPITITSLFGLWGQTHLPDEIFEQISICLLKS